MSQIYIDSQILVLNVTEGALGPALAVTDYVQIVEYRPCLVPKNFAKFFRFSVTSNI